MSGNRQWTAREQMLYTQGKSDGRLPETVDLTKHPIILAILDSNRRRYIELLTGTGFPEREKCAYAIGHIEGILETVQRGVHDAMMEEVLQRSIEEWENLMESLPSARVAAAAPTSPREWEKMTTDEQKAAIAAMSDDDIQKLSHEVISMVFAYLKDRIKKLKKKQIRDLTPEQIRDHCSFDVLEVIINKLKPSQLTKLLPNQAAHCFEHMDEEQISALGADQLAGLTPNHIAARFRDFSSEQIPDLDTAKLSAVFAQDIADRWDQLTIDQVAALDATRFARLASEQVRDFFMGISTGDLKNLSDVHVFTLMSRMQREDIRRFSAAGCFAILEKLTAAQIASLSPDQILALVGSVNDVQIQGLSQDCRDAVKDRLKSPADQAALTAEQRTALGITLPSPVPPAPAPSPAPSPPSPVPAAPSGTPSAALTTPSLVPKPRVLRSRPAPKPELVNVDAAKAKIEQILALPKEKRSIWDDVALRMLGGEEAVRKSLGQTQNVTLKAVMPQNEHGTEGKNRGTQTEGTPRKAA